MSKNNKEIQKSKEKKIRVDQKLTQEGVAVSAEKIQQRSHVPGKPKTACA